MKTVLVAILVFIVSVQIAYSQNIYVKASKLNLREKPNTNSKIIEKLRKGDEATVISTLVNSNWVKIITSELKEGYIHSDYITTTYVTPYSKYSKVKPSLNKNNSSKLKYRSYRQYIRGSRGGCYYINSNGNKTYVNRSYCK